MDTPIRIEDIKSMEQALRRIKVLEEKLDEAIKVIVRRDDQIDAAQRRIRSLEDMVENLGGNPDRICS